MIFKNSAIQEKNAYYVNMKEILFGFAILSAFVSHHLRVIFGALQSYRNTFEKSIIGEMLVAPLAISTMQINYESYFLLAKVSKHFLFCRQQTALKSPLKLMKSTIKKETWSVLNPEAKPVRHTVLGLTTLRKFCFNI